MLPCFYSYQNMERENVVAALAALAQDNRLDVFRLLVQTGAGGLPAGGIAERLGIPQSGRWSRARASNPDVVLGVRSPP